MTGDPLYEPLGTGLALKAPSKSRWLLWLAGVVLVTGAGSAAWMETRSRDRGDATGAIASIEVAPKSVPAPEPSAPAATSAVEVKTAEAPVSPPGSTVEMQNGVKIVRFNPTATSDSIMVPVDGAAVAPLKPAPDARVSEKTAEGLLPRIGADGSRPADLYARHIPIVTGPRAAVLLVGMGADQMATAEAARRLSPELSFAFGPDVADATTQVTEARRAGHEVMLDLLPQAAADPASRPGSDPVKILHRSMARFPGYVGALLDPTSGEMPTVRTEMAARGLLTLMTSAPAAKGGPAADLDVDAGQGPGAVAAALDRLADLAQTKGAALAVIRHAGLAQTALAALPDVLVRKGITLVPATAVMDREAKAPTAQK